MHRKDEMGEVKPARLAKKNIEKQRKQGQQEEKQAREPHTEEIVEELRFFVSLQRDGLVNWAQYQKEDDTDEDEHPKWRNVSNSSSSNELLRQKTRIKEERPDTSNNQGIEGEVVTKEVKYELLEMNHLFLVFLTTGRAELKLRCKFFPTVFANPFQYSLFILILMNPENNSLH